MRHRTELACIAHLLRDIAIAMRMMDEVGDGDRRIATLARRVDVLADDAEALAQSRGPGPDRFN